MGLRSRSPFKAQLALTSFIFDLTLDMITRPIVHTQVEAVNKELSQQLKTALAGLNALDVANTRVEKLETAVTGLEVKISNVSKVLKLQQEYATRKDALIAMLQEKVAALETNEKVLADLVYRVGGLEERGTVGGRVEERLQGLEERMSRLMLREPTPEREKSLERKLAVTLTASKEATTAREDLFLNKVQTTLQSFRSELDQLKTTAKGSPKKSSAERLQRLEQDIQTKASMLEVQRLGEILERELRSREASMLDSWHRVESLEGNKSMEIRPHTAEEQVHRTDVSVSTKGLSEVSKHLGTGYGSFGVSVDEKENAILTVPKKKSKRTTPKARPHSQSYRRAGRCSNRP